MQNEYYEVVFNSILEYVLEHEKKAYEASVKKYYSVMPQESTLGITEWVVLNTLCEDKTLIESIQSKLNLGRDLIKQIMHSKRSFFKVIKHDSLWIYKDVFSGEDFQLKGEPLETAEIVSARLVKEQEGYVSFLETYTMESLYEPTLKKFIFEHYNQSVSQTGPEAIDSFIERNLLIVFNGIETLHEIDCRDSEEEYKVHQARYAFLCSERQVIQLLKSISLQVLEIESGLYQILNDGEIVAEIEFIQNKFNLLVNELEQFTLLSEKIKTLKSDEVVFLEEKVLTLEDLLT